jgi:hypothetical protein
MAEGGDAMIATVTMVTVTNALGEKIEAETASDGVGVNVVVHEGAAGLINLTVAELQQFVTEVAEAFLGDLAIDVTLTAHRHRYDESGTCRKEGCGQQRTRQRKASVSKAVTA